MSDVRQIPEGVSLQVVNSSGSWEVLVVDEANSFRYHVRSSNTQARQRTLQRLIAGTIDAAFRARDKLIYETETETEDDDDGMQTEPTR